MLPVVNASAIPAQPSFVATFIPGNNAVLHVPYDNVAPSVSSVQIQNNARGNSAAPPPAGQPAVSAAPAPAVSAALATASGSLAAGAGVTFFAQVIGQGASLEAQGMLVQYEKMVALAQVKYKPSNASLPPPEPAGVFGRILQQEKAAPPLRIIEQKPAPPAEPATISQAAAVQARPAAAPPRTTRAETPKIEHAPEAKSTNVPAVAASAYAATARRNAAIKPGATSIEEAGSAV